MKLLSNGVRFYPVRETTTVSTHKKWWIFGPTTVVETLNQEGVFLRLFGSVDRRGAYELLPVRSPDNLGVGFDTAEEAVEAYNRALYLERSQVSEMHEVGVSKRGRG